MTSSYSPFIGNPKSSKAEEMKYDMYNTFEVKEELYEESSNHFTQTEHMEQTYEEAETVDFKPSTSKNADEHSRDYRRSFEGKSRDKVSTAASQGFTELWQT